MELRVRKKIFFVIPSLVGGGGTERVLVLLLRYLDWTRFEPIVVAFSSRNDYREELPQDIRIVSLDKRGRYDFFRLALSLSKLIGREAPSLICAFLTYTNYLSVLAMRISGQDRPLVLSEHNNLSQLLKHERFSFLKKTLVRKLYPRADVVVSVSKGVRDDLVANFGVKEDKCRVIYNAVEFERIQLLAKEKAEHPWFDEEGFMLVACGRLTRQKNYPMLLNAITLVLKRTLVRLIILGEGEDRLKLEAYAKDLGIESFVAFVGLQKNPYKYIAQATAFVLSSSWEGFGNVLIEAMACGVPVISTRCQFGPDEIIKDGINGLLVPVDDEDALAEAILKLLLDEPLRKRLSEAGRKRAEDFRAEKMVTEYERVFEEVTGCIEN